MLGLNCLIKDTRAVDDIKSAIQILVGERLAESKPVSFPAVYNELRSAGLEVDAESAGSLYNELYGGYNDAALSTESEIIEFSGKDVKDQQKAIVDNISGVVPTARTRQIGKLSPEKQVANMIGQMFNQENFDGTKNVNSVMKQMETLVSKAVKSLLPPAKNKNSSSLFDNLDSFFETEQSQFETLSGGVNTLETLHAAVKQEVDNYIDQITANLPDAEAQMIAEKWGEYTNGFIQSTYDLMLGKSDQNKLLNEALKQVKVDGVQIVDVNGNVKWQTLMEDGDPDTISEKVKDLFVSGIKDEQGVERKYTREQASRIGDYFENLYKKKLASVVQQKAGNVRSKNISAKNIISDFVKDQGFINLVKDKNGNLLLTQANWDEALEKVRRKVGDRSGVDVVVEELRKFLSDKKDSNGNKLFSDEKIDIIEKEFRQTVAAKLVPGTATPSAVDRLIALKNLNSGKAFEQSTQSALNNVLGVGDLDQNTINQVKQLAQAVQDIVGTNNVTGDPNSNAATNRGAYAFQAIAQVERKIKEIIRENKINKSNAQRIVKYISDVMGASSTSLLINPGNFGENILTGLASNIGESVLMAFTNPKLFKQQSGSFWTAFASHVSGGVANEVIAEDDISPDLQAGERLRLRKWGNEFKRSPWGAILKSPAYAVSIVSRTIMNSFDAGFNSSIIRKKVASSVYNALKANGLSSSEALDAMDKALNIDERINAQIDAENKRIETILREAGLKPTAADMAQNKRDMKLSLYEDALGQFAANRGIATTPKMITEMTKAFVQSAGIQAKVLTGKRQIPISGLDVLNTLIYNTAAGLLKPQQVFFKQQQKLEEAGKLGAAAGAQSAAEVWKNTIGRFAGGIANFMALAVTATPYGFVTAKSLRNQKESLLGDKSDAGTIFKGEPADVRRYAEYHNLARSMTVRAAMGTMAIGAFVLTRLAGDDEDEKETDGWVENLMQTKSGRRMLQKYMPLGFNIAAAFLYDVDDKKLNTKMERLLEVVSNTTGTAYDKWGSLRTTMERAKSDDDRWKAGASFLGGTLPTLNINQAEQITKFYTTIRSAVDSDYISEVKKDEAVSKAIYKNIETSVDAIMTNGAIEAIKRIADKDEKFNRFKD